jgi:hypothetical protein
MTRIIILAVVELKARSRTLTAGRRWPASGWKSPLAAAAFFFFARTADDGSKRREQRTMPTARVRLMKETSSW